LRALQDQPVQIHARNVAGLETRAVNRQLFLEVIQVLLGTLEQSLGLQSLDEGAAQSKKQRAFQIQLLRFRDGGAFCALSSRSSRLCCLSCR